MKNQTLYWTFILKYFVRKYLYLVMIIILCSNTINANADSNKNYNWDGFYAGFGLGYNSKSVQPGTKAIENNYFNNTDTNQLNSIYSNEIKEKSLNKSVLFGYNIQSDNLVFGTEINLSKSNSLIYESHSSIAYNTFNNFNFDIKTEVDVDYQLSLRQKLGYTKGKYIFFVAIGPSISRVATKNTFSDNYINPQVTETTEKKYVFGGSVAIGAGYAIGDDWSFRSEYVFNKYFDIYDYDFDYSGGTPDISYQSDLKSSAFSFSLIKHF